MTLLATPCVAQNAPPRGKPASRQPSTARPPGESGVESRPEAAPRPLPPGAAKTPPQRIGPPKPASAPAKNVAGDQAAPAASKVVPAQALAPEGAAPQAPFQLTPQEQTNLDRLLLAWEKHNANARTVTCDFERWEHDLKLKTCEYSVGTLKYKNPDNAEYLVQDTKGEIKEHWLCTGQSIFEYKYKQRELIERQLPPELQGKAIEDGPLPFVFNSNAKKLKDRYWLRLVPPPAEAPDQVWLEAYPKRREDFANFQRASLILNANEMIPIAVQVLPPGDQARIVHKFKDVKVNGFWDGLKRSYKAKPLPGWTVRVEPPQALAGEPAAPPDVANRPQRPTQPSQK